MNVREERARIAYRDKLFELVGLENEVLISGNSWLVDDGCRIGEVGYFG